MTHKNYFPTRNLDKTKIKTTAALDRRDGGVTDFMELKTPEDKIKGTESDVDNAFLMLPSFLEALVPASVWSLP